MVYITIGKWTNINHNELHNSKSRCELPSLDLRKLIFLLESEWLEDLNFSTKTLREKGKTPPVPTADQWFMQCRYGDSVMKLPEMKKPMRGGDASDDEVSDITRHTSLMEWWSLLESGGDQDQSRSVIFTAVAASSW